jgi:hypothetical protein
MWSYGRHFRVHHVDERRTTCDSCIACRFKEEPDDSEVDYVGIIEEILEVDFRSFKTLLLKVQWFRNTARLEDCLFYSIDTTKFFGDGRMSDQPFVFPNEVEQVFLAKDRLNPKRSFVLQDNPKCHIIFDKLLKAPEAWTDGSEVVGLLAGDQAPKSPPTNEGLECVEEEEEGEDSDDTLEDEDEREIGGALTMSRNEIEDLMWDEREDSDDERVQRTRYVPIVHCGLMVSKNQLSILIINLNYFLVVLPQGFGFILLSNEMVRCKM